MTHPRTHCLLGLFLLTLCCSTLPAQSTDRLWRKALYLRSVQAHLVSREDSALLDSLGVKPPHDGRSHHYEVLWGQVSRADDSARVVLYTTVTGTIWDMGSLSQRGRRIALNVEVHYKGLLAAVAGDMLYVFTIGGLDPDRRYRLRFGEFISANDWDHVVRRWSAHKRTRQLTIDDG